MFNLTKFCKLLLKTGFKHCSNKMPVFTQNLNPILGEHTWEWQDEDYDYQQEIARSSFGDMLHDSERNEKYYDAIKVAVDKMHKIGRKANVLDIGTGTGLLSMMAVRCGADSVVACEAFPPMSTCAKNIIKLNDCEGIIKIVPKHSSELTVGEQGDLPQKANILVTEVFDTELIGEGALATFNHAFSSLLEAECVVVPSSAVIYAQVVESPLAGGWNLFKDVYSDDGELLLRAPVSIKSCRGAAAVHDVQLSQLRPELFNEIFAPTPVMQFDWSGKTPISFIGKYKKVITAQRSGVAQIVFMWWKLFMDEEQTIVLSCAPYWAHPLKETNSNLTSADVPWRDHWMQAVYYLPQEMKVEKGNELVLITCHDEFSYWFCLDAELPGSLSTSSTNDPCRKPICECGFHLAHSRTRIGQLNDSRRNKKYLTLFNKYISSKSVVLLVSDGFYLGSVAAKLGAKQVIYLGDSYLSTKVFREFVKFNGLNNVEVVDDVEALLKHPSVQDINLVFGQPHFSSTILPWDTLHFAYLLRKIRPSLSPQVEIMPRIASIKGIVVEFADLQKIRLPLEACGEFDMKPFDDLIEKASGCCDASVEPQPLWEYPCVARSPVTELGKLDVDAIFSHEHLEVSGEFSLEGKPTYNGVALWVEWDLDGRGECVISTGPVVPPVIGETIRWDMHTRQGVHFLQCKLKDAMYTCFNFHVKDGKIKFVFC